LEIYPPMRIAKKYFSFAKYISRVIPILFDVDNRGRVAISEAIVNHSVAGKL